MDEKTQDQLNELRSLALAVSSKAFGKDPVAGAKLYDAIYKAVGRLEKILEE